MEISVNTYFSNLKDGKEISFYEKLKDIKNQNFSCVGIYLHKEKISIQEQSDICDKLGLKISYLHSDYGKEHLLDNFWLDNELGDNIENFFKNQIEESQGVNTKNIVFHLCGSYDIVLSEIAIERIKRLCDCCKKYNFNFCIENTFRPDKFDYIFERINKDNLKICYDVGHEFCLSPNSKLVEKHFDKISCLHIHDNCGTLHKVKNKDGIIVPSPLNDEHKILGDGTMDIDVLAKKLSFVDNDIPLNMEFKSIIRKIDCHGNGANIDIGYKIEDLKKVYERLCNLRQKIYEIKENK